jgi:putative intracellular protease/amidase
MPAAAHILVFDGYADWEPGFALAEIRRSGGLEVVSVGFDDATVRSMGGLRVVPDTTLDRVTPEEVRLFLLPGGDAWEGDYPRPGLNAALAALRAADVPVAAICGATIAAARAGLLDDRAHTSNERAYLEQHAPEYRGSARYVDELAVRDRGVITASGAAPVDFAREIFEELDIFSEADRAVWYHLFKHGRMPKPAA